MAFLDEVIAFAETLRPKKFADKVKASKIKQFVIDKEKYSNSYKTSLISNLKKSLINTNYFDNIKSYDFLNVPELYDAVFKQRAIEREKDTIVKNIPIDDIKTLLNFKNSEDHYELLCWLLFTSGLRLNELIDNKITPICIDRIKVDFISKKSNNYNGFIKYLIVPSNIWIDVFNQFQKIINEKSLYNPNSFSKGVKRVLLKYNISNDNENVSSHTLRALYLTYQVEIKNFEPDKLPSIKTKKLLNHSNENAGVFYTGAVKITGQLEDVVKNDKIYTKMKITDIKKILDDCNIKYHSKLKKNQLIALIPV
jgi:integrase